MESLTRLFAFLLVASISLAFVFSSVSPSVSLLSALVIALSWSLFLFHIGVASLHLFLVCLVVIGGLFVLSSFVLLSYPDEFSHASMDWSVLLLCILLWGTLSPSGGAILQYVELNVYSEKYLIILFFALLELFGVIYVVNCIIKDDESPSSM